MKRCTFCKEPARNRRQVDLSPRFDDGEFHWEKDDEPDHSPATLRFWTCEKHDGGACDAIMFAFDFGYVDGRDVGPRTCLDPFHSTDEGYEAGKVLERVDLGGGWAVTEFYRCPTCGSQTFSTEASEPDPEVRRVMASWFDRFRVDA